MKTGRRKMGRSTRVAMVAAATVAALMVGVAPALADAPTVEADLVPDEVLATVTPTFTGQATDNVGVARVQVAVKFRGEDLWLQPGGFFAATHRKFDATLSSPGGTSTDWSVTVPELFSRVQYLLSVRVTDTSGNQTSLRPWRPFEVDTEGPFLGFDSFNAIFASNAIRLSGTVFDRHGRDGVDSVLVAIEGATGWLQPGGGFGPTRADLPAAVSGVGVTSPATWSFETTLPEGGYEVFLRAVDILGNEGEESSTFMIDLSAGPIPAFFGFHDTPSEVTVHGIATDAGGVARVQVGIKQRDGDRHWLQPDGSFGPQIRKFDALLSDPGSTLTEWSFTTALPDAQYRLSVRVTDDSGNQQSISPRPGFEVDTVGPVIELAFPFGSTLAGPDVHLNGRLIDASFVHGAKLSIRDRATRLWLQADGSFGPIKRRFDVDCFCPDENDEVTWVYDVELDPGDYSLSIRASDIEGNERSVSPWRHFTVDPAVDPIPPTPTTDFPAGATFTSSPVTLSGMAMDDIAVEQVLVGVRDRDSRLWWHPTGFVAFPAKHEATLSDPRAPTTAWSFVVDLPDGSYSISVRTFDTQGFSASISPWRHFEVDTS